VGFEGLSWSDAKFYLRWRPAKHTLNEIQSSPGAEMVAKTLLIRACCPTTSEKQ
jgi:hypothetical protein